MRFRRGQVKNALKKSSGKARKSFPRFFVARLTESNPALENQLQAELHVAAAAVELLIVEERWAGSDEDVARVQWVGVGRRIERAVVGRQADAEVAMVEGVVGGSAELQAEALR